MTTFSLDTGGKKFSFSFGRKKFRYDPGFVGKVPMLNEKDAMMLELRREELFKLQGVGAVKAFDKMHSQWFADGLFYNDLREPFISSDQNSAATVITTDKPFVLAASLPVFGGQYWARPGKKLKIRMFGRWTSDATAGNVTFDVYYGSGAAANGTILQSSAAVAFQTSQTNLSWELEVYCHCRSTGSAGTLFVTGKFLANVALVLSTVAPIMIPASAAAVSAGVDLTAANVISPQVKQSGAGVWTTTVHDLEVISLN